MTGLSDVSGLPDAVERAGGLNAEWNTVRDDLATHWTDSRGVATDSLHLTPAAESLGGVTSELAKQNESATVAVSLCERTGELAVRAELAADQVQESLRVADEERVSARELAVEAREASSASTALVDDALASLSRAGARCGQATSLASLRADLDQAVRRGWVNDARRAFAKEFATELAWELGTKAIESTVETAIGRDGVDLDGIVEVIRESHGVMRAQIVHAVGVVRSRLGL